MNKKIHALSDAACQLFWVCRYAHLEAVTNKDENTELLAAIEHLADQVNMMAWESERECRDRL